MKTKPQPKIKTCKMCPRTFEQWQSTQVVCSPGCALELVNQKAAEKKKRETRQMRADFNANDRSWQLRKAQDAFNAYIRQRDLFNDCISCGKKQGLKFNAGHYLSVGAYPELRFNEMNCHLQCERCNSHLSGNIARYRINLIEKIGLDQVEILEGPHAAQNYTLSDIIEIKDNYKSMIKEIKNV